MVYSITVKDFKTMKNYPFNQAKTKNDARKIALDMLIKRKEAYEVSVFDDELPWLGPIYKARKPILGGKRYKVIIAMR